MQRELSQPSRIRELSALQLKRSLYISRRDVKAKLEPDGSASWVYGADAGKLLFGREAAEVFKIQAGVRIPLRPTDLVIRASPSSVSYVNKSGEKILVSQSVRIVTGTASGRERTVRLTNRGDSTAKLRVIMLHDPTSLNYRKDRDPAGEIGVDAFNRHEQVVMDDVGDTTGVRVIALSPRPTSIYLTKDKGRAAELLSLGDLPESSLGMSGAVIVLVQHDFDLAPGETAEVRSLSLYHPSSLESLLGAASSQSADGGDEGLAFASSSPSVSYAFEWAKAALHSIEGETNLAEKLWCSIALALVRPDYLASLAEASKGRLRKDGALNFFDLQSQRESADRAGPAETSLYVVALAAYLAARVRDKKLLKKWFPHLKKVAEGLAGTVRDGVILSPADSPDGWRRRLGAGYPTGMVAEVNLMAAKAFKDAASLASIAGKPAEADRYRELCANLSKNLLEKLRDPETGMLALNVDARGIAHKVLTVDLAVGLSHYSPDTDLSVSVVRRMLEKDFETGYGPRTVPTSNVLYFNSSYADGQLGGYWTRAALAYAALAFSAGCPDVGSSQLEKVARLVHLEAERLGGVPGEFPYWIDTERKQIGCPGSDPVAAARFIEGLIIGEAGLSFGPGGARFGPPDSSQLRWMMLHGLELGRRTSVFLGRETGRVFTFSNVEQDAQDKGPSKPTRLHDCERISGFPGIECLLFWDATSSFVCFGNSTTGQASATLSVPVRSKSFSSSLFANLEEFQPETGGWAVVERVKLLKSIELKLDLRPGSWKVVRLAKA